MDYKQLASKSKVKAFIERNELRYMEYEIVRFEDGLFTAIFSCVTDLEAAAVHKAGFVVNRVKSVDA
jgi:hypothetical protein